MSNIITTQARPYPATYELDSDRLPGSYVVALELTVDANSVEEAEDMAMQFRDSVAVDRVNALTFDWHLHGPHGC